MRNSRQGAIPSELGSLIDELDDVQRRLRILEAPSGEALNSTVPKLQALVADLRSQVEAWAATRWTNAQILEQIAAAMAAAFAGNVAITGSLTVNGAIAGASFTAGGSLYAGGAVTLPDVFNTDIAALGGSRKTVWVDSAGRMGNTA